jgi:hypothetical protein
METQPKPIFVFGRCPVQGEGEIEGLPWYFRARWQRWSLEVETPNGLWSIESTYGDSPAAASHMPHDEAEQLIRQGLERFRKEVLGN